MNIETRINRFLKRLCKIGLTSYIDLPIYKSDKDLQTIKAWLHNQNLSNSYNVSIWNDIVEIIGQKGVDNENQR